MLVHFQCVDDSGSVLAEQFFYKATCTVSFPVTMQISVLVQLEASVLLCSLQQVIPVVSNQGKFCHHLVTMSRKCSK